MTSSMGGVHTRRQSGASLAREFDRTSRALKSVQALAPGRAECPKEERPTGRPFQDELSNTAIVHGDVGSRWMS